MSNDKLIISSESKAIYNIDSLLKRAFILLEDGEFNHADGLLEIVLNSNPESALAYVGKLMIDLKITKRDMLKNCENPFYDNKNYQRAIRFANPDLKNELIVYNQTVVNNFENNRKNSVYDAAVCEMEKRTVDDLYSAMEKFRSISGWKDADSKAHECTMKIEELKKEQEKHCLELERKKELKHIATKKKKKKIINTSGIVISFAAIAIAVLLLINAVIIPETKYNKAMDLMEKQEFNKAYEILGSLGDYADAAEQIRQSKYNRAMALLESKKYNEAYMLLEELGDYNNSDEQIKKSKYTRALKLLQDCDYTTAYALLNELGDYSDAYEQLTESKYSRANKYFDNQEYSKYYTLLNELGDYRDCKEKIDQLFDEHPTFMIEDAEIGDTVLFGAYEQSAYGDKTPIEWQVLSKKSGKAFLISKKCLSKQKYNNSYEDVTWETCTLRKWLNHVFYNDAFSSKEKGYICTTTVKTDDNIIDNTVGGKTTQDKVFILSKNETQEFMSNTSDRLSIGTQLTGSVNAWLLRSPGAQQFATLYVQDNRIIGEGEDNWANLLCYQDTAFGIRPAIWVSY